MRFTWKSKYYWIIAIIVVSALACLTDLLIPAEAHENEFWWSHIPGFFAILGFIGCLLIIIIAKLVGHYWLQRKEDYYD